MAEDDKTLKVIESDVVPILERIEANTKTRAYKRRMAQEKTYNSAEKAEVMAETAPILAKREKVAKLEKQAADSRRKASEAKRKSDGSPAASKSVEAQKERREKAQVATEKRSMFKALAGKASNMLPSAKKGDAADLAGAASAGVFWSSFKEISDAVADLKDKDEGIIGAIKKGVGRNEKGQYASAEAQKEQKTQETQEKQQETLEHIADILEKDAKKPRGGGSVVQQGGGLLDTADDIFDLFKGKGKGGLLSKLPTWLGGGVAGAAAAKGGGLLARTASGAKGLLGRAAGGAGSLLARGGGALARMSPWLAGGAAAGAAGYGVGTLLNKGMGKLSALVTGGKYEGEGWLGDATFDLVEGIKKLVGSVDKNTEELRENGMDGSPVSGVNYGQDQSAIDSASEAMGNTARSVRRRLTGEKVDDLAGSGDLGGLSARYESGSKGSSAVGFDNKGGTSYGKYQIATRTGTMSKFMDYLKENNPAAYDRLKAAGPADEGVNGKFAQEWKAMAADGTLKDSEHDFIKKTHFDPAFQNIDDKGLRDRISKSKSLQDVLWSTSVQHGAGGASSIMNKVYKDGMTDEDLTNAIYAERGTKFGGSNANVRASVQNRFVDEKKRALAMLDQEKSAVAASDVSPAQAAQQAEVASASVNKTPLPAPASAKRESEATQSQPLANNDETNKRFDKLIALMEEKNKNEQKKEGQTDVNNNPNIPMEYDDAQLVLMAHDRA